MIMHLEIMASVTFSKYWNIFNVTLACSEGTLRKWQSSAEGRVRELLEYWCYHHCPFTHSVSTFQWVNSLWAGADLRVSKAVKLGVWNMVSYWNLTNISAVLLRLWHLSNSRGIRSWAQISQHWDLARTYRKVSNIRRTKSQNLNASRFIW